MNRSMAGFTMVTERIEAPSNMMVLLRLSHPLEVAQMAMIRHVLPLDGWI